MKRFAIVSCTALFLSLSFAQAEVGVQVQGLKFGPHRCEEIGRDTHEGNLGMGLAPERPTSKIVEKDGKKFVKLTVKVQFNRCEVDGTTGKPVRKAITNPETLEKASRESMVEIHYAPGSTVSGAFVRSPLSQAGILNGVAAYQAEALIPLEGASKDMEIRFATKTDFGPMGSRIDSRSGALALSVDLPCTESSSESPLPSSLASVSSVLVSSDEHAFPNKSSAAGRVVDLSSVTSLATSSSLKIEILMKAFREEAEPVSSLAELEGKLLKGSCFSAKGARPREAAMALYSPQRNDGPLGVGAIPKVIFSESLTGFSPLGSEVDLKSAYRSAGLAKVEGTLRFSDAGSSLGRKADHQIKRISTSKGEEYLVLRESQNGLGTEQSICYLSRASELADSSARTLLTTPSSTWVGQEYFRKLHEVYYRESNPIELPEELKGMPKQGFCVARSLPRSIRDFPASDAQVSIADRLEWIQKHGDHPDWKWSTEVEPFEASVVNHEINYGSLLTDSGEKLVLRDCEGTCGSAARGENRARVEGFESTSKAYPVSDRLTANGRTTLASVVDEGPMDQKLATYRKIRSGGRDLLLVRVVKADSIGLEEKLCYTYSDQAPFDRTWATGTLTGFRQSK